MNLFRKISLGINSVLGICYKILVDIGILNVPKLETDNPVNVIVSLTSYGRRVRGSIVYYTLVSLLRQRTQPRRIILWLDKNEWNDDTLPIKLKRLKEKGVQISYCDDIKSYKKLIPTVKEYPECPIITFDDDVIYSNDTVLRLLVEHRLYPQDIVCLHAARVSAKNGIPCDYKSWPDLNVECNGSMIFPIGEGGVLYPPKSLHVDLTNQELFMRYCPKADDIWFWICGLRNNTNKRFIKKEGKNLFLDGLYQYFHKGSALTQDNRFENSNDVQFKEVFDYYNIYLSPQGELLYRN